MTRHVFMPTRAKELSKNNKLTPRHLFSCTVISVSSVETFDTSCSPNCTILFSFARLYKTPIGHNALTQIQLPSNSFTVAMEHFNGTFAARLRCIWNFNLIWCTLIVSHLCKSAKLVVKKRSLYFVNGL